MLRQIRFFSDLLSARAGGAMVLAGVLALAPRTSGADVAPAVPNIPSRMFTLSDYGAIGDGRTPATEAFHHAVAAVDHGGGGTLVVPAGVYFTGPFDLCSRLNLKLEAGATILFSPEAEDYRAGGRFRPLLQGSHLHDVEISGAGTIDGHGDAWWPAAVRFKADADAKHLRSNTSPRPRMLVFDRCQRVRVQGITLTRSPSFNLVPVASEDVTIAGVTILNPPDSPNTDGIDPSVCRRVLITGCRIDTGDDCIAVKAGGKGGDASGGMEDLLVTDCVFLHGHGCSIGSETSAGLRNMTVRHCTFDGTDTGVRLKSDRLRGGLVDGVTYEDLVMNHVGSAVTISSYYLGTTTDAAVLKDGPQPVTATTPRWRNITIRNIRASGCVESAGFILGLPEMPAEHIVLENVRIEAPKGLKISNARDVAMRDVRIQTASGPDVITGDGVTELHRTR